GSGDPLARSVRGGGAAVDALRPFDRDVRAVEAARREPRIQERARLVAQEAGLDLDAGGAQPIRPAALAYARVRECEDHARDTGVDERLRAGAGAAGVIAGFEGDDRGRALGAVEVAERVDLGVGGAGAVVPALGERLAGRGEDDGTDLG